jgi:hypothetical protein
VTLDAFAFLLVGLLLLAVAAVIATRKDPPS